MSQLDQLPPLPLSPPPTAPMLVLAWRHGLRWRVCQVWHPSSAAVLQEAPPDLLWQLVLKLVL